MGLGIIAAVLVAGALFYKEAMGSSVVLDGDNGRTEPAENPALRIYEPLSLQEFRTQFLAGWSDHWSEPFQPAGYLVRPYYIEGETYGDSVLILIAVGATERVQYVQINLQHPVDDRSKRTFDRGIKTFRDIAAYFTQNSTLTVGDIAALSQPLQNMNSDNRHAGVWGNDLGLPTHTRIIGGTVVIQFYPFGRNEEGAAAR